MKALYPYQLHAIEQLNKIYQKSSHAYLQMPTGTGKTFTALKFAESNGFKHCVWLCGSKEITEQAREAAQENKIKGQWTFKTWQGFRSLKHKDDISLLIIDEIHFGGSSNKVNKSSIYKIKEHYNPKNLLYLSASPWYLNEEDLGETNKIVKLGLKEALQKKYINDVELNSYCVGLDASILAIETQTKRTFESLERNDYDKLRKDVGEEIAISVKNVIRKRISEMAEIYGCAERGNQCLFFCPTVKETEYAKDYLNKLYGDGTADYISGDMSNAKQKVKAFKDKKFIILCTCIMLNEGFDYPPLEVIFDCNFSFKNPRRTYQKIGRLLRVHKAKPVSRYYYAKDLMNLRHCINKEDDLDRLVHLEKDAVSTFAQIIRESMDIGDDAAVKVKTEKIGNRDIIKINLSTIIENIREGDHRFKISDYYFKNFEHAVDEKKIALLQIATTAGKRPLKGADDSWVAKLGTALFEYTTSYRPTYDEAFTSQLKSLRPEWFLTIDDKMNEHYKELLKWFSDKQKTLPPRRRYQDDLYQKMRNIKKGKDSVHKARYSILKTLRPAWI